MYIFPDIKLGESTLHNTIHPQNLSVSPQTSERLGIVITRLVISLFQPRIREIPKTVKISRHYFTWKRKSIYTT